MCTNSYAETLCILWRLDINSKIRGGVVGIDVSSGSPGISRNVYSESLLKKVCITRHPTASSSKYIQMRQTKHLGTNSYIECMCRLITTRHILYTFAMINKGDDVGVDATA